MSTYQDLALDKITKLFNTPHFKIVSNYRPDFLVNTETDKNLELDICIFLKEINGKPVKSKATPLMAFEIQGEQHFQYVRQFRNSPDTTRYRDVYKREICNKYGIPYFEIFYTEINSKLNILKTIISQKPAFKNKLQNIKVQQCFQILNFDEKVHINLDKWITEHYEKPAPTHSFSKRFLKKQKDKEIAQKIRNRKKKKKPTNQVNR